MYAKRVGGKLTAVPLITSIRTSPSPSITSKGGGDTLAIATLKLGGAATYARHARKLNELSVFWYM